MKTKRLWIETFALAVGIAFALSLLIATLGAAVAAVGQHAAVSATGAPPVRQQSYEGMLTCSRCGAKHSAALGKTATDCARVCVHAGAAFSLVDGDKSYQLDGDLIALKRAAGQRVRIVGTATGDKIKVLSIAAGS